MALFQRAGFCNCCTMRLVIFSILMATPVWAETPITGDVFEALVEGKTLTFLAESQPYGVEYYAPGRRVVWAFQGGDCVNGEWFEDKTETGSNICFLYENNDEPQCWRIFDMDGALRAEFMNTPGTTVLYEAIESEPLVCGGLGT